MDMKSSKATLAILCNFGESRRIATGLVTVRGNVLTHIANEREEEASDPHTLAKYFSWAKLAAAYRARRAEPMEMEAEQGSEPRTPPALNLAGQRQIATGTVVVRGNILTHFTNLNHKERTS